MTFCRLKIKLWFCNLKEKIVLKFHKYKPIKSSKMLTYRENATSKILKPEEFLKTRSVNSCFGDIFQYLSEFKFFNICQSSNFSIFVKVQKFQYLSKFKFFNICQSSNFSIFVRVQIFQYLPEFKFFNICQSSNFSKRVLTLRGLTNRNIGL